MEGTQEETFELKEEEELRIEVGKDKQVTVTLLQGTAEIFGQEIAVNQGVTVSGNKFAVFSWHGASVKVLGTWDVVYKSEETPMVSYINTHAVLEQMRQEAKEKGTQGPRVLVCGPTDSGKSTLCRTLINYCVRCEWLPTFVDLDIGQGQIALPGTLSATPVEEPVTITHGYPLDVPLVYFLGHVSPSENQELYTVLMGRLAGLLQQRATTSGPKIKSAGMIVNTMGWVDGLGYQLLLHAIDVMHANVVIVLGQERLYSQLARSLGQKKGIKLVKLNASGGVVPRSIEYRKKSRTQKMREYFYGVNGDLCPHSMSLGFNDIHIYRVGGGPKAPTSALPIGATSAQDPLRLNKLTYGPDLQNSIVAISHAKDVNEVISSNVAGFIYVTEVDTIRRRLIFLKPCPGPLPNNIGVTGTLKWFESLDQM